jgi:hypothetical protein
MARDECPAGQYLVGLVGNAGLWLDQITVVCASLNPDMKWSSARTLPSRGGSGGHFTPAYCKDYEIVTAITIERTKNYQIAYVNLTCSAVTALTKTTQVIFGGTGNYAGSTNQNCVAGEAATGLTISYGSYVTGVGLICGAYKGLPAAICAAGMVWRESFEGDAACVTPDARFRKPDGTCRSGYVWRNLVNGDNVCVTPNDQKKAWVAAGKPLEGTTSGSSGGFIQMIPTAPPQQQANFIGVLQDVDLYRAPGGNEEDKTGVTLPAGTESVALIESQAPWHHVKWPGNEGWVYSAADYKSLNLP